MRKPRTKKTSTLKGECDQLFSKFIRQRDAKAYHGEHPEVDPNYVACCSCGDVKRWQDMDAGHFVSRKHNTTRYHPCNVHAQCRPCNRGNRGNITGYSLFMVEQYGTDGIKELDELSKQLKQFRKSELLELAEDIKEMLKGIL